jgi:hypothetical protein
MLFELPGWLVWVLGRWLLACVCLAAGLSRWFRWLRD